MDQRPLVGSPTAEFADLFIMVAGCSSMRREFCRVPTRAAHFGDRLGGWCKRFGGRLCLVFDYAGACRSARQSAAASNVISVRVPTFISRGLSFCFFSL